MDIAYLLNSRPFRENSLIVDLLTEHSGLVSCFARVSKSRGKIIKGSVQPFIRLAVAWSGKGNLPSITTLEETGRFNLAPSAMSTGLYYNELLYRLLPMQMPNEEVFAAYQTALYDISRGLTNTTRVNAEIALLKSLGILVVTDYDVDTQEPLDDKQVYNYLPEYGISQTMQNAVKGIAVSGAIMNSLSQDLAIDGNVSELRQLQCFLDSLINLALNGKKLHARALLPSTLPM